MAATPQSTGRILKRAQYRNHRALDRALQGVGTTLPQWDALRAISESPDSSAHDLAVATFQSDQAFGTLANRLVSQGLVERTAGSGRRIEHRLTGAGHEMLGAGLVVLGDVGDRSFAGFTAGELQTLFDLLSRVGEGAE